MFAHLPVYDELVERTSTIRIGDPLADETELGPPAFGAQRDKVAVYVDLGRSEGARVLAGGAASDSGGLGGYFYEPTVMLDVDNGMRVLQEEILGPVVAVMPFDDEDEVVRLSNDEDEVVRLVNDTEYGLAAGVRVDVGPRSRAPNGGVTRGRGPERAFRKAVRYFYEIIRANG